MHRLIRKSFLLMGLCVMLFSACDLLSNDPEPVVLVPTIASGATVAPVEPTAVVIEPVVTATTAAVIEPTATETSVVVSEPEPPTPTPTPATGLDSCVAPELPEGVFYLSYQVQPGDTLFNIGQKARPSMSVAEIAAANCLTDVNRIEVGQQLIIWHSPTTGPARAVTQMAFETSQFFAGQVYNYAGPLANGEHAFALSGEAGQVLTLNSTADVSQLTQFVLQKSGGSLVVGEVSTAERNYFDPNIRGRTFTLPEAGDYELVAIGQAGIPLAFTVILADFPFNPQLVQPTPIQFQAGASSARVAGLTPPGFVNRYRFTAFAGQVVTVNPVNSPIAIVIEDLNENQLMRTDYEAAQVTLPADGDYLLMVCHCGSEGILSGPYEFEISIDAAVSTPTPAAGSQLETIQFNEVMNGWLFTEAKGTIDSTGAKFLAFTLPGNANLSLTNQNRGAFSFTLFTDDGATSVGSFATNERNHLLPSISRDDIFLPGNTAYLLRVTGSVGAAYDLGMTFGTPPHPEMGTPARVQFEAGAISAQIAGEIVRDQFGQGSIDRYLFTAAAGQEVYVVFGHAGITNVMIEDANRNVIYQSFDGGRALLPADGDYIMNVWLTGGEVYGSGPYDFSLFIE